MHVNRLACATNTTRWWLVAAIAAIVIGAFHPKAGADVGVGPEPATNQQGGLDVAIVVGIPAQAGDITATAMRRICADVFATLEPGDKITIAAARGSGRPIEVLSIIRRAEDAGAAGAATVARAWREKADPLAGRSADVAAGLAELLAGRGDASIDLLVVVPAARVGSTGASSIWASAKRARDGGAVVWLIGPPDSDLQDAAKTGVLNWTSVDAATPATCAAWVAQARRNRGGGPTVAELQGEIEKVRAELAALRAQGEKDRAVASAEITARDDQILALRRNLEQEHEVRGAAEARQAAATAKADEHERAATDARAETNAAQGRIQALIRELDLAKTHQATAERALDDFRSKADADRAALEGRFQAASIENDHLRAGNALLRDDHDRLQAALNDLRNSSPETTVPETPATTDTAKVATTIDDAGQTSTPIIPSAGGGHGAPPAVPIIGGIIALLVAAAGAAMYFSRKPPMYAFTLLDEYQKVPHRIQVTVGERVDLNGGTPVKKAGAASGHAPHLTVDRKGRLALHPGTGFATKLEGRPLSNNDVRAVKPGNVVEVTANGQVSRLVVGPVAAVDHTHKPPMQVPTASVRPA